MGVKLSGPTRLLWSTRAGINTFMLIRLLPLGSLASLDQKMSKRNGLKERIRINRRVEHTGYWGRLKSPHLFFHPTSVRFFFHDWYGKTLNIIYYIVTNTVLTYLCRTSKGDSKNLTMSSQSMNKWKYGNWMKY